MNTKLGFTLVELSIVLVIIGLLIGGILVAQSMINTAKIQGVVRQITQYDVALGNFQTKYQQLPGDTNMFDHPGNNNGMIESINHGPPPNIDERAYFWYHLSEGVGLINSHGTGFLALNDPQSGPFNATNCPQFNLNQPNSGGYPCLMPYGYYNAWDYSSIICLSACGPPTEVGALLPVDAAAIDAKIDDGLADNSGKVFQSSPGTCATGSHYNVNNTGVGSLCILIFPMGLTTGNRIDQQSPGGWNW